MLKSGTELLMIPGPTTLPPQVLRAISRSAIDIYHGPLHDVSVDCLNGLREPPFAPMNTEAACSRANFSHSRRSNLFRNYQIGLPPWGDPFGMLVHARSAGYRRC